AAEALLLRAAARGRDAYFAAAEFAVRACTNAERAPSFVLATFSVGEDLAIFGRPALESLDRELAEREARERQRGWGEGDSEMGGATAPSAAPPSASPSAPGSFSRPSFRLDMTDGAWEDAVGTYLTQVAQAKLDALRALHLARAEGPGEEEDEEEETGLSAEEEEGGLGSFAEENGAGFPAEDSLEIAHLHGAAPSPPSRASPSPSAPAAGFRRKSSSSSSSLSRLARAPTPPRMPDLSRFGPVALSYVAIVASPAGAPITQVTVLMEAEALPADPGSARSLVSLRALTPALDAATALRTGSPAALASGEGVFEGAGRGEEEEEEKEEVILSPPPPKLSSGGAASRGLLSPPSPAALRLLHTEHHSRGARDWYAATALLDSACLVVVAATHSRL
ncbi:hypothetical protein H632_c3581p0, partial [Helicosporidium sp. ATCC 50920]